MRTTMHFKAFVIGLAALGWCAGLVRADQNEPAATSVPNGTDYPVPTAAKPTTASSAPSEAKPTATPAAPKYVHAPPPLVIDSSKAQPSQESESDRSFEAQ